jgi:hypothetical protein
MEEWERAELKAELMAVAEAQIDEVVKWNSSHEQPTLREIEEVVLAVRQRLGEAMARAVVQRQASVRPVPGPVCAACGQEMRYKDSHKKQVTSWVGEMAIERGYYYCAHCRSGLFPPG